MPLLPNAELLEADEFQHRQKCHNDLGAAGGVGEIWIDRVTDTKPLFS